MPEERQPHVEENLGGRLRVQQAADDVQREAAERERTEPEDRATQHAGVPAEQPAIDEQLREVWDEKREDRSAERDRQHRGQTPPVRPHETEEPANLT